MIVPFSFWLIRYIKYSNIESCYSKSTCALFTFPSAVGRHPSLKLASQSEYSMDHWGCSEVAFGVTATMLSNSLPLLLLFACTLSTTNAQAVAASEPYDNRFSLPHLTDDQNQVETANLDGVSHTANHGSQVVFLPTTKLNVDGGSAITDKDKVQKHGHFDSVPLPVESPTKSFWLDTPGANPLAEQGSTGELTRDADVCVVGSGITGVSAAWHLSKLLGNSTARNDSGEEVQRQRSVVILEARRFC